MSATVEELLTYIETLHVRFRSFTNSPETRWCAGCPSGTVWPCEHIKHAARVRLESVTGADL